LVQYREKGICKILGELRNPLATKVKVFLLKKE
jgi:hypothetical protein